MNPGVLEIVFNIVNIDEGEGRSSNRTGICTGMFDRLTQEIQSKEVSGEDFADVLSSTIEKLNIMNYPEVYKGIITSMFFFPYLFCSV